jgi:BirA family transcriptional regulator, biotin operon repressor / biotin---[acetyl-CoA-carboxylase] ligase
VSATAPRLGRPRIHLRRTDSTNERLRTLAMDGAPHGTLVSAEEQSAGRGRQGRAWSAPAGSSLLMSVLLREPPSLLPLIAAVATCDALDAQLGDRGPALIKWPNDIVIEGPKELAKLAGILAEGRPQEGWAVLGVGINVAVEVDQLPEDVRGRAATLGGSPGDVEPVLEKLLKALERRLSEPTDAMLLAWSERDVLRGREVRWGAQEGHASASSKGTAQGVDGAGRLVVGLSEGGQTTLEAGEVHLAPMGRP